MAISTPPPTPPPAMLEMMEAASNPPPAAVPAPSMPSNWPPSPPPRMPTMELPMGPRLAFLSAAPARLPPMAPLINLHDQADDVHDASLLRCVFGTSDTRGSPRNRW